MSKVYKVDGFELTFTRPMSRKVNGRRNGELIDNIYVTWTKGYSEGGKFLRMWPYKKDMKEYLNSREPFIVAVAVAKDWNKLPHSIDHFDSIRRVVATGQASEDGSIETRVLERI